MCGFLGRITRTGPSSPFGSSFIVGGCIACLIIHCVCQYNTVHGGHTGRHEGGGSGVSIVGDGRDAQRREHVAEEDARRRFFDADVAVAVAVRTSRRHPHRHVLRQRMGLLFFCIRSFIQSIAQSKIIFFFKEPSEKPLRVELGLSEVRSRKRKRNLFVRSNFEIKKNKFFFIPK